MDHLIGTLEKIGNTKEYPKKDGSGNVEITKLKIDGKFFTSFRKSEIQDLKEGDKVEVDFIEKKNNFEGKTYINYNIVSISPYSDKLSEETEKKLDAVKKVMEEKKINAMDKNFSKEVEKELKGSNVVNVGNDTFKVTIEKI